jgi:phage terminase large subunit-like protein
MRIIGVDPSVAEKPHDECGIVVVYISATYPVLKRHAIVVDDLSLRAAPEVWGKIVVQAAIDHNAVVVAEVNQGANLVSQMLRLSAMELGVQTPPVRPVWASKAKAVRSEPVGGAYAQGRVHHLNVLAEYEDQCVSWVPGDSAYSPDRLDAGVHGLAAGMFPEALISGIPGSAAIHSVANQTLPMRSAVDLAAFG